MQKNILCLRTSTLITMQMVKCSARSQNKAKTTPQYTPHLQHIQHAPGVTNSTLKMML